MARREITGFSNPLVKRVRKLRDKKHRRREGLFIAEGLRILTEAREAGHLPKWLFMAEDRQPQPLADMLEAAVLEAGGEVIETSRDILSKLSGKDNPQILLGVYEDLKTDLDRIDRSAADIWIVAERLRDPGNIGTILRTGDAVGAGGLILVGECADPFSAEAVRASMGAVFTQNVAACEWADFTRWLRAGPGQLVGASLNAATDYQDADYVPPVFVLIGNEAQGMPAEYEEECDLTVKIPMRGKADSLNAALANAVLCYEVLNQLRRRT